MLCIKETRNWEENEDEGLTEGTYLSIRLSYMKLLIFELFVSYKIRVYVVKSISCPSEALTFKLRPEARWN